MPVLPDAVSIGPFVAPTRLLTLFAATWLVHAWTSRRLARSGLEPEQADAVLTRALVGAWLGAKGAEVLRTPASFLASPRLLISPPVGVAAVVGALAGAFSLAGLAARRGRREDLLRLLDLAAVPLLAGGALTGLGVGDGRALPLALAFLAAALVLRALESQAAFPGHSSLAAIVLGGIAFVAADFFRPLSGGYAGVSGAQFAAFVLAAAAYAAARRWERGPRGRATTERDGAEG